MEILSEETKDFKRVFPIFFPTMYRAWKNCRKLVKCKPLLYHQSLFSLQGKSAHQWWSWPHCRMCSLGNQSPTHPTVLGDTVEWQVRWVRIRCTLTSQGTPASTLTWNSRCQVPCLGWVNTSATCFLFLKYLGHTKTSALLLFGSSNWTPHFLFPQSSFRVLDTFLGTLTPGRKTGMSIKGCYLKRKKSRFLNLKGITVPHLDVWPSLL